MRHLLAGLTMGALLACAVTAWAGEGANMDEAPAAAAPSGPSMTDVTGIPVYQGPGYSSLRSNARDVNGMPPEFHAFSHRPVDEVGYSPLTLADFRYPVVKRANTEFGWERATYPTHSAMVSKEACDQYEVSAFFFTRDQVRDHIQMLIDEYYICDPDVVQQLIDYYAEVTPQCGEAISWVWLKVKDNYQPANATQGNRFFAAYLNNFKDKFHLDFGLLNAQDKIDHRVNQFLYQYRDRGKYECGPQLKEHACGGCNKCAKKDCNSCQKCSGGDCGKSKCGKADCGGCGKCDKKPACGGCGKCGKCCPEKKCYAHDEQLYCDDFQYHGFTLDPNQHYLYSPNKVLIEDITWDAVAQAYRWKFAWRFNTCELDWLKQMCEYGERVNMGLVISDPTWYARAELAPALKRDILAAADPNTWGNVWPASKVPFDMTCCDCPLPACGCNCPKNHMVGWQVPAPPAAEPPPAAPPAEPPAYFPPPAEPPQEVVEVPGKG